MNSKGQAGAVFKLLIAAIIGLVIFVIISSLITQTESQKKYLIDEIFLEKINMAVKNPTGTEYVIENAKISKGTSLNAKFLMVKTGLKDSCFSFESEKENENIKVTDKGIFFTKDMKVDVAITCNLAEEDEECNIKCEIKIK